MMLRLTSVIFFSAVLCACAAQDFATFEEYLSRLTEMNARQNKQKHLHYKLLEMLDRTDLSGRQMLKALEAKLGGMKLDDYTWDSKQATTAHDSSVGIMNVRTGQQSGEGLTVESGSDMSKLSSLNGSCFRDAAAFVAGVKYKTLWSLAMLDSFGRPTPGLLEGRLIWAGYYEECVAVSATYQDKAGLGEFQGRYCGANVEIDVPNFAKIPVTSWGLCLPDSCDNEDAGKLLYLALQYANVSQYVRITGMTCHHPLELPTRAIAVIVLVAIFIALVIVATAVDLLLIQWPIWRLEAINRSEEENRLSGEADSLSQTDPDVALLIVNTEYKDMMYRPGVAMRLLLSFSAWSNSLKIWNTRQPPGTLSCVNGVRVISISWVILGHCIVVISLVTDNMLQVSRTHLPRWTFQAIYNATFSVDSFFVMSGLLVSYLTLNELSRKNGKLNWVLFYLHRYLRLTPVYMMCLAIFAATMPFWTDGPFYLQQGYEKYFCEDNWWANLLYVQNIAIEKNSCFSWGWYLAVDMQFFVLSPLIILPFYFRPLLGYLSAAVFFLATTITPFVLTMTRYYGPGVGQVEGHKELGNRNYDIYVAPYCRMGPYVIGMVTGYLLYRCNCRVRIPRIFNLLGWALATALALTVLYGLSRYADTTHKIDLVLSAFYNALSRSAWGLCVAWVIFACVTGHGGLVNSLLSLPVWVPLSRLTYAAYLTHPIIMGAWALTRQTAFYLDDMTLIMFFFASLMATYAVSYLVSLTFEAPVMGIEKVVFNKDKRS